MQETAAMTRKGYYLRIGKEQICFFVISRNLADNLNISWSFCTGISIAWLHDDIFTDTKVHIYNQMDPPSLPPSLCIDIKHYILAKLI